MLKNIKAVLFDLDGTLVDSMWVWAQIDVDFLGSFSIAVPKGLQKDLEGMGFTEVAIYFKKRFQLPLSVDEIKATWNQMAMDRYCNDVPLKEGAAVFLQYLQKKGIKMAVASSNSQNLIRAVLKSHGVDSYFDEIITACEVERGKPFPDVYLEAARRLEVLPEQCLVFEDIVPGVQAGKAAGMKVCAVQDTYSIPQEREKKECADYFIRTYNEIINDTYEEC